MKAEDFLTVLYKNSREKRISRIALDIAKTAVFFLAKVPGRMYTDMENRPFTKTAYSGGAHEEKITEQVPVKAIYAVERL